jgi:hypothetical protein
LKLSGPGERREGIAIVNVDPASTNFGKWIADYPLPPDLVAHHIFYDRTRTKAYISALGKPQLHVMDLTANPTVSRVSTFPNAWWARMSFSPRTTAPGI